ncbi:MAG: acyltransferase [Corynebacterium sp.]|nr:acyltransferase [Corynebacterium sp.]
MKQNLPSLTGARWWAAFAVYMLHALIFLQVYPFQKTELFATIHRFVPMQLGAAGVTFFFILSGFLIYWSNQQLTWARTPNYVLRRVTKIFPTHLIGVGLFLLASYSLTTGWVLDFSRLEVWLPNVLLVHTWVPSWANLATLNVPDWSLAAEMLYYLTFPLLIPLVRRIHGRGNWIGLAGTFLISLAIITCVHLFAPGSKETANFFVPILWDGSVSPIADVHAHHLWFERAAGTVDVTYWLSYYFPVTRFFEFYLGVFAAKLIGERQFTYTRIVPPLVLLALSYMATWWVPLAFKMSVVMSVPMTLVIATLAARDIAGKTGWIGSRFSVLLGNISFAFYIVQFPVMVAVQRYIIVGAQWGFLGWFGAAALCFAISVVLSWVIYTYVDAPLMRAVQQFHFRVQ